MMNRLLKTLGCFVLSIVLALPAMAADYTKFEKEAVELEDFTWDIASRVRRNAK